MSIQLLPDDLLLRIFASLPAGDAERCQQVCRRFQAIVLQNRARLRKFDYIGVSIFFGDVEITVLPEDDKYRRATTFEVIQCEPTGMEIVNGIWLIKEIEEKTRGWSKQGLRSYRENFTGRHLRLSTTLSRGQLIRMIVDKLKDRFIFTFLRVNCFSGSDVEEFFLPKDTGPIWAALKALPDVEHVHLGPFFNASYSFPTEFLQSAVLKSMKRFSFSESGSEVIFGDEDLLSTNWEEVDLEGISHQITMDGVKRLLDAWQVGNRRVESISLLVEKLNVAETKEDALRRLHECVECDECQHWTENVKGELLIVEVFDRKSDWGLSFDLGRYAEPGD